MTRILLESITMGPVSAADAKARRSRCVLEQHADAQQLHHMITDPLGWLTEWAGRRITWVVITSLGIILGTAAAAHLSLLGHRLPLPIFWLFDLACAAYALWAFHHAIARDWSLSMAFVVYVIPLCLITTAIGAHAGGGFVLSVVMLNLIWLIGRWFHESIPQE